MGEVVVLGLGTSTVLPDARGEQRALQVTWHDRQGVVVLSTWRAGVCVATVHLTRDQAAELIARLADGVAGRAPR